MAIGPPWQRTSMSGRTFFAASAQLSMRGAHSSSVFAVFAPMEPFVVSPMWQTRMSAPASAMATASSSLKTYGVTRRSRSCAALMASTSRPYPMPVSSRLARKTPSMRPTVGKFCTPANPREISSSKYLSQMVKGSVPLTPARTGVFFTTGRTSYAISLTMSFALP